MTVLAKMGRKALPGHVRLASFDRHEWRYMPPHGTTKDMLLDPSFWSHVSKGFTVGDKIEVRPIMALDIMFDHRMIDGDHAGRFLSEVAKNLENFDFSNAL